MPSPSERLATSLEALQRLQAREVYAIRSADLGRADRERLMRSGFIREVLRGWYVASRPGDAPGETTAWYMNFWSFCVGYLDARFGDAWLLTAEQSLLIHADNRTVPVQLLVRAPGGRNQPTALLHGTSIFDTNLALPPPGDRMRSSEGLRVYSPEAALVAAPAAFYANWPSEARTVLALQRDASALLARLLAGGHSVIAGRLAGAMRNIGRDRIANDILRAMRGAGYDVRETDPFTEQLAAALPGDLSPASIRIRLMWEAMRTAIPARFPPPPRANDTDTYLTTVEHLYVADAYHSLSIEGYRVSAALIDRVRGGGWNPDHDPADRAARDTMAARGYWQAFQQVKESLRRILDGVNPGTVADDDHGAWYLALFGPSVEAGIIDAAQLAGYRQDKVYLRHSRHVPLSQDAVHDAMPTFFDLLRAETDPAVRVVLGHFIFVYIHPYMDGNGRMGRFLMNAMNAAAGYPWTIIPVEDRAIYFAALETASVDGDIGPFADYLASRLTGPPAVVPNG